MFEYLADVRGFRSAPAKLMAAAAACTVSRFRASFDAAILVKRYGTPLYSKYMWGAIHCEDLGQVRFALAQGLAVSRDCYQGLIETADATLLHEVLRAKEVCGCIPEDERALIERALRMTECHPNAKKVLADHSIVV